MRAWLEAQVSPEFEGCIFSVDTAVARCCPTLHVPDPDVERDILITAMALVHGMTVVSRDVADFRTAGVPLRNLWEPLNSNEESIQLTAISSRGSARPVWNLFASFRILCVAAAKVYSAVSLPAPQMRSRRILDPV